MKNIFYLLVFASILFYSCGTTNKTVSNNDKEEPVRIANDSLEYEIIILDNGFNTFLATTRPMSYYTQSGLETKNRVLVLEWNARARNSSRYNGNIYENIIDYQPNIDYGMEVNYKLYQYFQFAQRKYNMRLSSFRVETTGNVMPLKP